MGPRGRWSENSKCSSRYCNKTYSRPHRHARFSMFKYYFKYLPCSFLAITSSNFLQIRFSSQNKSLNTLHPKFFFMFRTPNWKVLCGKKTKLITVLNQSCGNVRIVYAHLNLDIPDFMKYKSLNTRSFQAGEIVKS
jgi:hypothetical protein